MEAFVVNDIKKEIDIINSESEFYKSVIDRCEFIKTMYPCLSPLMTCSRVSGHFGEVLATEFAMENYNEIKKLEAGVVQGTFVKYAQEIGAIPKELMIIENVNLNYRRRIDIKMMEEDDTVHEFESKATSLISNNLHESIQLQLYNLKPDVPQLIITVFNWMSSRPEAAMIYIPDHTKVGKRRRDMTVLGISAKTYKKLILKISIMTDGIVIKDIDLLDDKYAALINKIVKYSKFENSIEDVPLCIIKSAVEKIVAKTFDLTLTGNVRSDYDALDKNGRKIEIKCGTIAPICDRHGVQAVLLKVKPDNHDELFACFHLPYEDKIIIIKDFKNTKKGTLTFSGNSLKMILTSIVTKSGGDKNKLLLDIYKGLGDIDRIESDLFKLIEENKRDYAVERHLHHASVGVEKRKEKLVNDLEKLAEYLKNKSDKAAERRKGLTAKVLRGVDTTPVVVPEGKTEEEVRKEMLDRLSEEEMKRLRTKKAAYEKARLAKKKAENPPTEAEIEAARAKKREYEAARRLKKRAEKEGS